MTSGASDSESENDSRRSGSWTTQASVTANRPANSHQGASGRLAIGRGRPAAETATTATRASPAESSTTRAPAGGDLQRP